MAMGRRLVGRPVEQLVELARRIGEGDLEARVHLRQRDELASWPSAMNQMCERLLDARAQVHRQRDGGAPGRARAAAPRRPAGHRRQARLGHRARAGHAAQRGARPREDDRLGRGRGRRDAGVRAHHPEQAAAHDAHHPPAAGLRAARAPAAKARSDLPPAGRAQTLTPAAAHGRQGAASQLDLRGAEAADAGRWTPGRCSRCSPTWWSTPSRPCSSRARCGCALRRDARRRPRRTAAARRPSWVRLDVARRGRGHGRRDAAPHLRALLHHQGRRRGHRARASPSSYGIVRDHGGWIDVSSEPGQGSTLLHLPARRSEDAA